MATSGVSDKLAEVGEIRRSFAAQRLEDDGGQFEDDRLVASLAASASATELVRCGRVAWCPSEVAPPHSGSTADAGTSCDVMLGTAAVWC